MKQPAFGAGPVFLYSSATDNTLGWTYEVLINHIWSIAGEVDRNDVDATFLQPFVSYTCGGMR